MSQQQQQQQQQQQPMQEQDQFTIMHQIITKHALLGNSFAVHGLLNIDSVHRSNAFWTSCRYKNLLASCVLDSVSDSTGETQQQQKQTQLGVDGDGGDEGDAVQAITPHVLHHLLAPLRHTNPLADDVLRALESAEENDASSEEKEKKQPHQAKSTSNKKKKQAEKKGQSVASSSSNEQQKQKQQQEQQQEQQAAPMAIDLVGLSSILRASVPDSIALACASSQVDQLAAAAATATAVPTAVAAEETTTPYRGSQPTKSKAVVKSGSAKRDRENEQREEDEEQHQQDTHTPPTTRKTSSQNKKHQTEAASATVATPSAAAATASGAGATATALQPTSNNVDAQNQLISSFMQQRTINGQGLQVADSFDDIDNDLDVVAAKTRLGDSGAQPAGPRKRNAFTVQEDEAIVEGIQRFTGQDRFTMTFNAYKDVWMPGRTAGQLLDHWRGSLRHKVLSGAFTTSSSAPQLALSTNGSAAGNGGNDAASDSRL